MNGSKNNKCKQCGICCKVIPLNSTKKSLKGKEGPDAHIIGKYFRRISKPEAARRLKKVNASKYHIIDDKLIGFRFYECLAMKNNKCTIYNERGYMCNDYPYYKHGSQKKIDKIVLGEFCGFHSEGDKK